MSPISPIAAPHRLHVVLVEPEIPPNTGAIARLCAATNTVLHSSSRSGSSSTTAPSSAPGWITGSTSPGTPGRTGQPCARRIPQARFHFLTTKTERPYTEARFDPDDFLVFGRETKGLPESCCGKTRRPA